MKYVTGTVVNVFTGGSFEHSFLRISTPGIITDMPVNATNGDFDACDFYVLGVSIIPSSQEIMVYHSGIETYGQHYRINYGYWARV